MKTPDRDNMDYENCYEIVSDDLLLKRANARKRNAPMPSIHAGRYMINPVTMSYRAGERAERAACAAHKRDVARRDKAVKAWRKAKRTFLIAQAKAAQFDIDASI